MSKKRGHNITFIGGGIGDYRTFLHVQGKADEPFEGPYVFYFEGPRDKDEEMAFNIVNNKIGNIGKMTSVPHGSRAPDFTLDTNDIKEIGILFEERDADNLRGTGGFVANASNEDLKAAVLEAIQKLDITGDVTIKENAARLKGSLIERLLNDASALITIIPFLFTYIGKAQ